MKKLKSESFAQDIKFEDTISAIKKIYNAL